MEKEDKSEGFDPEATKEVLHHLERIYDEQERTFWQIQQKIWVILGAFSAVLIAVISTQSTKILNQSDCLYFFYGISNFLIILSVFLMILLLIPKENIKAPRIEKLFDSDSKKLFFNEKSVIQRQTVKDLNFSIKKRHTISEEMAKKSQVAIYIGFSGLLVLSIVLFLAA